MNFHQLLHQRDALLKQAHLANMTFAYQRLGDFSARIARARLQGPVRLHPGHPESERPWPQLTALEGSQAVIEEHFLDEDVIDLMDILAFLGRATGPDGQVFHLEEIADRFQAGLRRELERAGLNPGAEASQPEDSSRTPD